MTPKEIAAMQQALEAIGDCSPNKALVNAAYALREALAEQALQKLSDFHQSIEQAEQEPVAIADGTFNHNCPIGTPLYAAPVPTKDLTDDEIADIVYEMNGNEPTAPFWLDLARAVIQKFKEKNNANNNT